MVRPASPSRALVLALALLGALTPGCSSPGGGACDAPVACNDCGPLPPEAKPGEAWCCVWVPPVEGTVEECVCVKPETTRCEWVPPVYATRQKLVMDQAPSVVERTTPGQYATRRRQVEASPAHERTRTVTVPGKDPCTPPSTLTVTERTPAVVQEECSRVALRADRVALDYTPGSYRCVDERYEVSPGFSQTVREPAQWATVTRKVVLQPGRWEWRLNPACTVPEAAPLPAPVPSPVACAPVPPREKQLHALELEMIDLHPDGNRKGVFKVGSLIRYEVRVASDTAQGAMEGLRLVFALPPELEYVTGSGAAGLRVQGAGQQARTSEFRLEGEQSLEMHIVARVKAAPATELLQVAASVEDRSGETLASETESSTVPSLP